MEPQTTTQQKKTRPPWSPERREKMMTIFAQRRSKKKSSPPSKAQKQVRKPSRKQAKARPALTRAQQAAKTRAQRLRRQKSRRPAEIPIASIAAIAERQPPQRRTRRKMAPNGALPKGATVFLSRTDQHLYIAIGKAVFNFEVRD